MTRTGDHTFTAKNLSPAAKLFWSALVLAALPLLVHGDVLVGINGERFVGTIITETTNAVVFDSELAGKLTFPREKISELQHSSLVQITNVPPVVIAATNLDSAAIFTNAISWKPPGVGHDKWDWVQLKSGEWLKGDLKYVQNKEVEFDSSELEMLTLKLKDVRELYTAHRVFTRFDDGQPIYGSVILSNEVVTVGAQPPVVMSRDALIGITPSGGKSGIRNWSGNLTVGLSLQSGNNSQTTVNTSAELARRTPNTTLLFTYLANYSQVNDVESANNQRFNTIYDVRLNQDWFVRPVQFEYYQDTLANISYRLTGGVGAGYYIFDHDGLEWTITAGPGYQYTRFETVEAGASATATTPAAVLSSNFKIDITDRLTFIQNWESAFTKQQAGLYTHHAVTTLEFEIKQHLNLDVSFIWDYLQNPQTRSDGAIPQKSDYYLTVGFGVRF